MDTGFLTWVILLGGGALLFLPGAIIAAKIKPTDD